MLKLKSQSGIILMMSLILLLLLTLIATTALETSLLEEKMRANYYSRSVALQAAESSLREAEAFISGNNLTFNPLKLSAGPFQGSDCVQGLCPLIATPLWSVVNFNWLEKGRAFSGQLKNVVQAPRYVIELMHIVQSSDTSRVLATFRITTIAWGLDSSTFVQLQSYFKVPISAFVY